MDAALTGTAADRNIQRMMRQPEVELCCAVLGKHGKADGYQFKDNNGMARCAFTKPCPYHGAGMPEKKP
jgi:hypothetical protein